MNPMLNRTFKALCAVAVVTLLSACGSSTTVDPFKPTRVIGLGDGYNDTRTATGGLAPTVREGASTNSSVVEQVATYFGQTNVLRQAVGEARISGLSAQITAVGSFNSGDLVVITVGTFDVKANPNATLADRMIDAGNLVTQVQQILDKGATHVLIMPVLELSRTPWGRNANFSTSATATFNSALNTALSDAFGGRSPNRVIYANASGLTSEFLKATDSAITNPTFDASRYDGTSACGNLLFVGCDASAASAGYATMLFADGIHLTPAGNRWVAQFLYNATAQGWR